MFEDLKEIKKLVIENNVLLKQNQILMTKVLENAIKNGERSLLIIDYLKEQNDSINY